MEETNEIHRRIFQIIEVEQKRESLNHITEAYQSKIKLAFDKKTKKEIFQEGDLVLRRDYEREENSKHGKFDNDLGGYRWPPTFSNWLKTVFWQFWQFTIFSKF
jgi:hypothetical protein